ncbi:TetR/AcrR family transcriptional regulator [Mycobacterium sp.]|uniref:TetR/AcrR family transcriptional regulator n=1 Tax=Mycobacterium sp. TaxID=1785 RepID=UPI003C75FA66
MMARDWLAASRSEVAADRILDAAAALFAERDAAAVGMHEIARAAGCSRATLYRYFENREALHTAFVNREAYRLFGELGDQIKDVAAPAERLVAGVTTALRAVRGNPALASWFATTEPPIGGELAEQSEVIKVLTAAFLNSLGPDDPAVLERRARWLVRVITSLLIFPGADEADERQMLQEFVVPMVVPQHARTGRG